MDFYIGDLKKRRKTQGILKLVLRNFKAFGDPEQQAPLSRITLIYGPNSGGKSSIIQALLLLKQMESEYAQGLKRELVVKGRLIDLNNYASLRHRHDTDRDIDIGVEFRQGQPGYSTEVLLHFQSAQGSSKAFLSQVDYVVRNQTDGPLFLADAKFFEEELMGMDTWLTTSHLAVDDQRVPLDSAVPFPNNSYVIPQFQLPELFHSAKLLHYALSHISWREFPESMLPDLREEQTDIAYYLNALPQHLQEARLRDWEDVLSEKQTLEWAWQREQERLQICLKAPKLDLKSRQVMAILPDAFAEGFTECLRSVTYLGPLRSHPQRLYAVTGDSPESTGIQGEHTPQLLHEDAKSSQQVNQWFERFEIPYKVNAVLLGTMDLTGQYLTLALTDTRTNTQVTLADVGFGINQILPIITEGVAAPDNAIICVEQPEIHIHPRLQAHLADLLIETSEGDGGKQWIVETHSELLIMRIQRRIREGSLKSTDVSVLYVDPHDPDVEGSAIKQLHLDEEGDFIDVWPDGFFDENLKELM